MPESLRGFGITVLVAWLVLCVAAALYSQSRGIPDWITFAVVPAFLVEAALYIGCGFASVRARLEQLPPKHLALAMVVSAPVPYLIYSIGTGIFNFRSLLLILLASILIAFWFIALKPSALVDTGFLLLIASAFLFKDWTFKLFYPDPLPKLSLYVLGLLMWIRLGMLALLSLRKLDGVGFGFVPRRTDWLIGLRNFALFLPIAYGLAVVLDFVKPQPNGVTPGMLALAVVTFFITLWVLAAAEEMFFRGILQQMLGRVFRSDSAGLVVASLIFGASHLMYNDFPNWKFAILATAAGLVYGKTFQQAGSVRAAMVTHALVNTTWRVFLF